MKIICSQENLARGLSAVKPAISSKSLLPILTHILIDSRAGDGRVRFAATNLDVGINGWIPAQVEEPGAIAVPARLICDFVNTLPQGQVEMTLNVQTQTLRVISGRMAANIKGIDAKEFPELCSSAEPKAQVPLEAKALGEMLDRVVFAAATDESRPVLAGVLAKFDANRLTLAGADGFRLSVQHKGASDTARVEPLNLIIPVKGTAGSEPSVCGTGRARQGDRRVGQKPGSIRALDDQGHLGERDHLPTHRRRIP